ncbi:alpha/beta fold hydrolase [Nonomuraea wenchangensis]|uniref:Pimeloyl-ACP methyl ester carboxylesterase n=1 Tax=Nonomuraea wenchangensis TaxID=568860 RepID=A0A1I0KM10_9ACTN|nr:alpha/beta hydrolase [Nonomuraea wenchangensis]SEU26317.1 Pimeloyl-ACP methyl ester carboxylesterase [Nonomuraea wenchangensis]
MSELRLPGVGLHYEVAGSGPALLLIPGGTDDARDFAGLLPHLTAKYTVISYDPRGNSRSALDGPPADVTVETHADDALRLLLALTGDGRVRVFGTSAGAQVALALTAAAPDLVDTVVAHEPPALNALPDGDPRRDLAREVGESYRAGGVAAALATYVAGSGLDRMPEGPAAESAEAAADMGSKLGRMQANADFFFARHASATATYLPDVAALRGGAARIVLAAGEQSAGQLAHDAALALAGRLGLRAVTFPGGHAGYVTHPTGFARALRDVLDASLTGDVGTTA